MFQPVPAHLAFPGYSSGKLWVKLYREADLAEYVVF